MRFDDKPLDEILHKDQEENLYAAKKSLKIHRKAYMHRRTDLGGVQIMKLGILALWPFGKEVRSNPTSGCLTTGFNVLWIIFGWWEIALTHLIFGAILCITIIGIPLGTQHFKLAKYSLFPFGCIIR